MLALDSTAGVFLEHRADERFAMCSTFKWALAAAVLARFDRAELRLAELVPYGERDLLEYAPTTRAHLADGAMSTEMLARALVTVSDNTAANLLLAKVRGPAGLPATWRVGDKTGSGNNGACNDVAIAWPARRAPVVIASYLSEGQAPLCDRDAVHAEIGRMVAARLA